MSEFDQYARKYDATVNDAIAFSGLDVDFFTKAKSDDLLRTVARHRSPLGELALLDVGCGIGNYHAGWTSHFREVHGIDVSVESIDVARASNPGAQYQSYDGLRLPYGDGVFDVLVTICVMHHVPPAQWPALVSEFKRVLKPGGLALVYEHNPLNPLTRRVVDKCEFDVDAVLLWPRPTRRLFEGAGFEKVRTRSILTVPPLNGLLAAADRAMGWQPFGAQFALEAKA
ncbi:class I SAM-dependent methyltransferase [Mesorhizobium sp. YR577]|uniref:class I SAM-dependent methyltransferase n=1 Tax=Mesorhizobium sp. YR577 TaxID=1884373 RepID=UPI0008E20CF4|nr:class I SAM-dependent methyltransferase [Mesorhizobium sp. YR577]SFU15440.1 Ubiquinone/menaquinone biosynthesis C-methylase UbiE [Mesorhizobium sp. YR577]